MGKIITNEQKKLITISKIYAENKTDINFVEFMISGLMYKNPEYIPALEEKFGMSANQIVNQLLEAKEALIELEREYKQSLITNNVDPSIIDRTRDDALPMIDSRQVKAIHGNDPEAKVELIRGFIKSRDWMNKFNFERLKEISNDTFEENLEESINHIRAMSIDFVSSALDPNTAENEQ